jgi:hypothetical protein
MYPRPASVIVRLTPSQAEVLYFELLGLISFYGEATSPDLGDDSETALRLAIAQLDAGLTRAAALGELQLQQLRAITSATKGVS